MQERSRPVIATGIVSLITFFTILILTVFSFLILSGARSDSALSERTAQSVSAYYSADVAAEAKLEELYNIASASPTNIEAELEAAGFTIVKPQTDEAAGNEAVENEAVENEEVMVADVATTPTVSDRIVVSYTVPINDLKELYVEIGVLRTAPYSIERLSWQTVAITA